MPDSHPHHHSNANNPAAIGCAAFLAVIVCVLFGLMLAKYFAGEDWWWGLAVPIPVVALFLYLAIIGWRAYLIVDDAGMRRGPAWGWLHLHLAWDEIDSWSINKLTMELPMSEHTSGGTYTADAGYELEINLTRGIRRPRIVLRDGALFYGEIVAELRSRLPAAEFVAPATR